MWETPTIFYSLILLTERKVPIQGKRNILITGALPYVNNVPHLGNIIGCVLSADVFALYCRHRGYNVLYICGTDEYGTATETTAMEEGSTPKEIRDKYHAIHKDIYNWFNINFDEFGRTSTPKQTEICQAIFAKLFENNWLSENTMQQPFCDTCQHFLADRLVEEGTCPRPNCNYDSARGDQCEKCGQLLNTAELKDPKCKVCQATPRIRHTDHLFLELPLLKNKLVEYINKMSDEGSWSENAIKATYAWVKEGLKPRCITRDLKWGVLVPHEKYKDKLDAPIVYVLITACHMNEWEKWWKNPEDVELYQFMGKDNVPFHNVMFPSALLGTGEKWTLMKSISVTEYLKYESDTLFTWKDLQAKLNAELLNNLGNFVYRVSSFITKPQGCGYGSVLPDAPGAETHCLTKTLAEKIGKYVEQYVQNMEKVKLKQGLKMGMSISSEGNAYLQNTEFWKLYKEDEASCSIVIRTSVGLVYLLACLLEPFMPSFTIEVLKQLNLPPEKLLTLSDENGDLSRVVRPWELLPAGHVIGTPVRLFNEKLANEEVEHFSKKFAGSQADRALERNIASKLEKTKISG